MNIVCGDGVVDGLVVEPVYGCTFLHILMVATLKLYSR